MTSTGRLFMVAPSTSTSPLIHHGRQHAGNRDRGTQPTPQHAAAVHFGMAGSQIGRHAKKGQRQILDGHIPKACMQKAAERRPE